MKNSRYVDDYYLTVSEFANLCGTTRDTLRHYYEIGVIVPQVDTTNGYHLYSPSQITSFYYVSTLRNLGCSLKDIKIIMSSNNRMTYEILLDVKMKELKQDLIKLRHKRNALQCERWLLNKMEQNPSHRPGLETIEPISIYQTPIVSTQNARYAGDIASDIKHHLNRCKGIEGISTFPLGTTITIDNLTKENYVYHSLFSISLHTNLNLDTTKLPTNQIVSCVHDNSLNDITLTYQEMLDFCQKNQIVPVTDLFILNLVNIYELEEKHSYSKYLFFCVKRAPQGN